VSLSSCSVLDGKLKQFAATLKNDDAEDSEDEGDEMDTGAEERKMLRVERSRVAAEKQPTGRIIGIIKRNWRA
jgi:exosome complex exonuclease DIS3/RRP44